MDRLPALSVTVVGGPGAVRELPAVRLVVRGDPRVRAAGLGADPRTPPLSPVGSDTGCCSGSCSTCRCCRGSAGSSVRCRGSLLSLLEALFPALFGLVAVSSGGCPAGRCGSRDCGRPRNGSNRRCRSAGSRGGSSASRQTDSPLLPLAYVGGAPLVSFAVALLGFSVAAMALEIVRWWRRDAAARAARAARGRAARPVHQRWCCWSRRSRGRMCASPVPARATSRPSPSPRCRATCRGSAGVQRPAPRGARQPRRAKRCGWPTTCGRAARRNRCWSSGRRTPRTSTRWPMPDAAAGDLDGRRGDRRAHPGRRRGRRARLLARQPGVDELGDRVESRRPVPSDRHDKQIVQPFGEYLPWRSFFSQLSPYADRAGYFIPGDGNGVVHAAGVPVGVTTCWEVIFDRAARESVRNGAQLLAVPSQQRHLRRGDERAAAGVRQAARRRARPLRRGRRDRRDQRRHRPRRSRAGPHRVLRTGLPRPADPVEDRTDTRHPLRRRSSRPCWSPSALRAVLGAMLHNGSFVPARFRRRRATTDDGKGAT